MTHEDVALVELAPAEAAVVRGRAVVAALPDFLGHAFEDVMRVLSEQHLAPAGPPFARYAPVEDGFEVEAGFPVETPVVPSGRVIASELPGGPAAQVLHRGSYASVGGAYEAATRWLAAHGYAVAGEAFETYLDGPEVAVPRTLVTVPCRPSPAPSPATPS